MARKISYRIYKQKVFNAALLECFVKIQGQILNGDCEDMSFSDERMAGMRDRMTRNFFNEELKLEDSTINQSKARLSECVRFLREAADIAEEIAEEKAADAEDAKLDLYDDQEIELSEEDEKVLDQLFDSKGPTPQIDEIRDSIVDAMLEEERKSQEIRDATDIAKAKAADGSDPNALEETVKRLNAVGPTSLMNAIMTNVSVQAIKEVSEAGNFSTIEGVMRENADGIKDRAMIIYSLYEMSNKLGVHKYTPKDVKDLTFKIYYER